MRLYAMLFIALAAAFAATAARGAEAETLRVGVCLSLSGGFQESGKKALAGIRLRVDDFNAVSEDLKLELVVRDDASDPTRAAEIALELAARDDIPAILGPLSTSLMMEMRETARKFKTVLISPSVTSPKIGKDGDWAFRLLFDDSFQGVALARFLRRNLGLKTAGTVINERFAYAASAADAFREHFSKEGGRITAECRYSWIVDEEEMYDFDEILKKIAQANPDIVLLPLHSPEVAALIGQSTMSGMNLRFCGGDTWQHEVIFLSGGNNLQDSYFVSGINFDSESPAMKHFLDLYDKSQDPDAQPTSVLGFDAASLLIEALKNGRDGESIRDGLYSIKDFELATGTITIHRDRGSEKSAFIHRISMRDNMFNSQMVDEIKP